MPVHFVRISQSSLHKPARQVRHFEIRHVLRQNEHPPPQALVAHLRFKAHSRRKSRQLRVVFEPSQMQAKGPELQRLHFWSLLLNNIVNIDWTFCSLPLFVLHALMALRCGFSHGFCAQISGTMLVGIRFIS